MTRSRREVYNKSWFRRECKTAIRLARKKGNRYNRKIRHCKISDYAYYKKNIYCETIS